MNDKLRELAVNLIDAEGDYFGTSGDSPDVRERFERLTAEMSVAMMDAGVSVIVLGETAIVLDELDETAYVAGKTIVF